MSSLEPYKARRVSFVKQLSTSGWKLKVYAISAGTGPVTEELVATGLEAIVPALPRPAVTSDRYGLGFAIIHRGTLRNWFLLDWWEYDDILFHKLFSSPLDDMKPVTAEESAAIACVHELKIIDFECEAWINTALRKDGGPDFDGYLEQRFES